MQKRSVDREPSGTRDQLVPTRALLDSKQAAKFLGIGLRLLWTLKATGQLACVQIGRAVRFDPRDLLAFIESRRVPARG